MVARDIVTLTGFVTPAYIDFILRRAKGGASMLVLGAVATDPNPYGNAGLGHDKFMPGFKDMVEQVHSQTSCRICLQLYDAIFSSVEEVGIKTINRVVDNFEKAAIRAQAVGVDAVELHCAHSYLLAAFLSTKNKREDEYGKDMEGRMKLPLEIIARIREAVGKDYPIGVRINADEFIIGGNTLKQSRVIAQRFAEAGIDYISLSVGAKTEDSQGYYDFYGLKIPMGYPPVGGYSGYRCIPPAWMPEAVNVYLAEDIRSTIRKAGYTIPVMTAGRIPYPRLAEEILQTEKADLIGLSRPLLRDPDWPLKAKEGREKEIEQCAYCNKCMESLLIQKKGHYCTFSKELKEK